MSTTCSNFEMYRDFTEEWSRKHGGEVAGTCVRACREMVRRFPELTLRFGTVRGESSDRTIWWHTWCVLPDGTIVDPTVNQFASLWPIRYREMQELPIGRCMCCGEYIMKKLEDKLFCSADCCREFTEDLNARGSCLIP